ncbi:MAG: DUF3617 domain-containing protein, partial [Novosphingobium sp.]
MRFSAGHLSVALPLVALAALAGCGKSADDKPKSVDEVMEEAKAMEKPEPGKYKSSVKVLDFEVPGIPAEQAAQMKQMMSGVASESHEFCLKPEDVEKGFEEMVRKTAEDKCTFDKFDASANAIDAKMTCEMEQGMASTIAMNGTTTPTKSVMTMDVEQKAP